VSSSNIEGSGKKKMLRIPRFDATGGRKSLRPREERGVQFGSHKSGPPVLQPKKKRQKTNSEDLPDWPSKGYEKMSNAHSWEIKEA